MSSEHVLPIVPATSLVPIAEHVGDWQRLQRVLNALEESQGFHFIIISCRNELYRDALLSLLAPTHPHNCVHSLRLWKNKEPSLLFTHLKTLAEKHHPIHLIDTDSYFPDLSDTDIIHLKNILGVWNRARNGFAADCPIPLILWANEALIDAIALYAPDLWAWRHSVYQFDLPRITKSHELTAMAERAIRQRFEPLPTDQRKERLHEMLHNLSNGDIPPQSRAHLTLEAARQSYFLGNGEQAYELVELAIKLALEIKNDIFLLLSSLDLKADILELQGNLDEAMHIRAEELIPMHQQLLDARSEAITQGKIADILCRRGQLAEALRIRKEKQLPVFKKLGDIRSEALAQSKIADILQARGQLDDALRIRTENELPVHQKLGDIRSEAATQSKIADILYMRGQLDDAMRIRTEKELPVYQMLGDTRSEANTQSKIADILFSRGQLDEALRIRREIQLPVYQKLGDIRSVAITHGQIADIFDHRGQFEESLRIRREKELPVYQKLGDILSEAVTNGKIAGALHAGGQLDEALRIRTEKELPVYQKLGVIRSEAVCLTYIALIHIDRWRTSNDTLNQKQESNIASNLLAKAWSIAHAMQIPEQLQIEEIAAEIGLKPETLSKLATTFVR